MISYGLETRKDKLNVYAQQQGVRPSKQHACSKRTPQNTHTHTHRLLRAIHQKNMHVRNERRRTHTHAPVLACHPSKQHANSKRTPQNTHTNRLSAMVCIGRRACDNVGRLVFLRQQRLLVVRRGRNQWGHLLARAQTSRNNQIVTAQNTRI